VVVMCSFSLQWHGSWAHTLVWSDKKPMQHDMFFLRLFNADQTAAMESSGHW
jgi:hypothetical protein